MFFLRTLVTAMLLFPLAGTVCAQVAKYPNRPVTMVVPFPPGGGTDVTARLVAQKLSEKWGQPVIIENRPGASGNIGLEYVSKAKPDGYTILLGNIGTQAINPLLYKSMSFDPDAVFDPITLVTELPLVLVVNPAFSPKNVPEVLAYGKANPGELTYGTSGQGSSMHLAAELFGDGAKITLTHVPYKGGGPAIQDLIGNHIKCAFATVLETSGHLKAGRLRAIAVTSSVRSPALPAVPTVAETGLAGFNSISWNGLLAPKGTPKNIIDLIANDTKSVLVNTDAGEKLVAQGAIPKGTTPGEFAKLIADDRARYGRIIKEKNITAE